MVTYFPELSAGPQGLQNGSALGSKVQGSWFRVQGLGFRV